MNVGIVGHEAAKFGPNRLRAMAIIESLLAPADARLVSGRCHLGGIDIWAEAIADAIGRPKLIFPPKSHTWTDGYKPRNIEIATASAVVHVIVVQALPRDYDGMRFDYCYHCKTREHVKSGGCWTARYAQTLGKLAYWHVV